MQNGRGERTRNELADVVFAFGFVAAATALLAKLGVAHVDPNLATAIRTSVVVLFAWTIALSLGAHGGVAHIDRGAGDF